MSIIKTNHIEQKKNYGINLKCRYINEMASINNIFSIKPNKRKILHLIL